MNKPSNHTVSDIMSTELTTVTSDQTLSQLVNLFEKVSYHHLPVVDGTKIIGIISDRDISTCMSPFLGTSQERKSDRELLTKKANHIMTTEIISVDSDTDLDTASILLMENNISCLPVVGNNQTLLGLLTWKDLLKYFIYTH